MGRGRGVTLGWGLLHHFKSVDEMKHLLVCATMELESARTVATMQDQVHRAWVQQMEELLQIARYERDEARKECLHLQHFSPQHMCSPSPHSSSISIPTACLHSGSAVASLLSPLELCDMSKPSSMHPGSRLVHLPEPPEADPQVMLNSLPEKGKLLQAVMQAGPLLQTLLLAGPLPQWRYPPPVLDTVNIPQVPISSSTSCDSRTVITNMDPMAVRQLNSHSVVHLSGPTCTQDNISRLPSPLSSTSTAPCAAGLGSQGLKGFWPLDSRSNFI
ncbi:unnamed protein product [Sphagnum tenellum]